MNASRLQQLFAHYIDKFEYINNPELNENYKWEIVKQYQEIFNWTLLTWLECSQKHGA